MDDRQISHDILNALERLRIMHDLVRDQNFETVSREELKTDLMATLIDLKKYFEKMIQ